MSTYRYIFVIVVLLLLPACASKLAMLDSACLEGNQAACREAAEIERELSRRGVSVTPPSPALMGLCSTVQETLGAGLVWREML